MIAKPPAEARPDPDALLARLHHEGGSARSRLKIFFGASAGVGKTYAMLEAARSRSREGVDVIVGVVETHGRSETAALLEGLELLPLRAQPHGGVALHEFDLDAALARAPQLILIDELAHTNAPGSRHAKRWQDVVELLDAGIDVHTTLNVQHLESLAGLVAQVTGIVVRETVPDTLLDRADEVELVDLSAEDLLARLRDGKVYLGEQAQLALENFFKKSNLVALRELALRATADRVDEQVQLYRRAEGQHGTWPVAERLMLCISPSPSAVPLVRAARRLATRLRADWIVLYVEMPKHLGLSERDRNYATNALRDAERLGAEVLTVGGHDPIEETLRVARQRNVSRILVGKAGRFWWRDRVLGSFVDRLIRRSAEIDVFVMRPELGPSERAPAPPDFATAPAPRWPQVGWGVLATAISTALCWTVSPRLDPAVLTMIYLVGVVVVAARATRTAATVAALLSVAAFDFFFVPPQLSFNVSDTQYIITFAVMLLVALIIGALTARVREYADVSRSRERRTAALFALSRDLVRARGMAALVRAGATHISEIFPGEVAVFLRDPAAPDGPLDLQGDSPPEFARRAEEAGVARWAFDHAQPAGLGTDTLPGALGMYLPLTGTSGPVGILGWRPASTDRVLRPDQGRLLETFANQLALALERELLVEEAGRARLAAESEALQNSLLSSVSHDLRTPLAAIRGAASTLRQSGEALARDVRQDLVEAIDDDAERMERLIHNLLDMTRLEGCTLQLQREPHPLEEIVGASLALLQRASAGRTIRTDLPEDLPLVLVDAVLVERVFVNLVENALHYATSAAPIDITARRLPGFVEVTVADRGPGLPPGETERLFEKFRRGSNAARRAGSGLGLAICRGIVVAHGGTIRAENRAGGGATFSFTLPTAAQVERAAR